MEHLLVTKTLSLEGALTQKHYEGRIQSAVNICISDGFVTVTWAYSCLSCYIAIQEESCYLVKVAALTDSCCEGKAQQRWLGLSEGCKRFRIGSVLLDRYKCLKRKGRRDNL